MRRERLRVEVRPARPEDGAFVLAVAARLAAFDVPAWRSKEEIVSSEVRTLTEHFARPRAGSALFVACDEAAERLGFVFLETLVDYFTAEPHGHVAILAVSAEAEGAGAGRALMDAAERWARDRGFGRLTLNVFERNRRARDVYEHLGYRAETLRYVKLFDPPEPR